MRQYYLCNPEDQAISGPHPFGELIRRAQAGEITPEWFAAEPGSDQFTMLSDSFSLNEILFCGGIVPVEPPPVSSVKLRGAPSPVVTSENDFPGENTDHNAEFAKVVAKSGFSLGKPGSLRKRPELSPMKFTSPNEDLTPENVLHVAREDMARVLKKHDDDHFNPPTYWESPAGERMRTFLYAEGLVALVSLILLGFLWLVGGLDITSMIYLLSFFVMLSVGLGLIIFFLLT